MAATKKAQVTIRGRFPTGATVGLYAGGDFFVAGGQRLKTAKVDRDGSATFSGLEDGRRYFVAAEIDGSWRHAAVTAKVVAEGRRAQSGKEIRQTLEATRAPGDDRAAQAIKESAIPAAHEPTQGGAAAEPHPRIKQADVPGDVPQRAVSPMGEGHPADPDELQPKVPQSAVPEGTQQRSDTPLGEATLVDPGEVQPGARQEDVPAGVEQRSDTPHGQAEPVPTGSAVDNARARDDSAERAEGPAANFMALQKESNALRKRRATVAKKATAKKRTPAKKRAPARKRPTSRGGR